MTSTSSSVSTSDREARPYEQVASEPSRVQAAVSSLDFSTSRWGMVLAFLFGDVVGLVAVLGLVALGARVFVPDVPLPPVETASILIPFGLFVYLVAGLYHRRFSHPALEMQRMGTVTLLVGLVGGGTFFLATEAGTSALLLVAFGGVGSLVMPMSRTLFRILFSRTQCWGIPAVIVSTGGSGTTILETLNRWPEIGIRPVALLTDGPVPDDLSVPVQGEPELAPYLGKTFDVPYVILAMPSLSHTERANLLAQYAKFFDHVFVVPDPGGAPALWTTGRSGDGLFGYGVRNVALRPGARFVKRSLDVCGALFLLVALAPLLVTIAVLIRMDAPGAIFYRQERMGWKGRIVTVLKFRTMYEDADARLAEILENDPELRREYERYHKLQNDPRVTRIGTYLRRYSLDELPQIWNVLRGDMSLVGPRAYMPSELPQMSGMARAALQSPPGMTGLWQVSGRNHLSFADRVHLDVHYVQNWSLWLDLYLLIRTIPVVLTGHGAS